MTFYVGNMKRAISTDPRSFWRFARSMKSSGSQFSRIYSDGEFLSDSDSIANCFADCFGSVYLRGAPGQTPLSSVSNTPINVSTLDISISEIFNGINVLSPKCGMGIDGVPSLLLMCCIFIVFRILWIIYNKSLKSGIFPSYWKQCVVTPMFKGRDEELTSNYRPISKQSIMSKIFDCLIEEKMRSLCKNVIASEQHGFVPGRSTATNLLSYYKFIVTNVERGTQIDSVYTDFSTAFDTVDHEMLLCKLRDVGFSGVFLRWLSSFLKGRTQFVRCNGSISRPIPVTSGVPQGSHLGLLLFILFVNDIGLLFKYSRFLFYADDLKIYRRVESPADAELLQEDLSRLEFWCKKNHLFLNVGKCRVIRFSRRLNPLSYDYFLNRAPLETVPHIRDSGMILSQDLSFDEYIRHIVAEANRALGLVCRWHFAIGTLRLLYCALYLFAQKWNIAQ